MPCPFCGADLNDMPRIMTVHLVKDELTLQLDRAAGHFSGSERYYLVECCKCGSKGARGYDREKAVELWNRRA